jgi:predicted nucleic acid-binding protein
MEMQPSDTVRSMAELVLAVHPLRAADALQLAAAILWCGQHPAGQSFVAFDERLRDASHREGFTVLPEAC